MTNDPSEYGKRKFRGIIYIFLGSVGLIYEIFFADSIRSLVIIGYSTVILLGIFYFTFFKSMSQQTNKSD